MKGMKIGAAVLALVAGGAVSVSAQTATQSVGYSVSAINQIAVTGSPSLTVTTATAGSAPTPATDATSSWAITTNATNKKLTASINTAMPTGVTLEVNVTAPSTGTSASFQSLSTTAVDVVTAISQVASSGLGITYRLSATLAAGTVASASKTVTYTLVTGP